AEEGEPRENPWANFLTKKEALELYSKEGIEPAMHGLTHAHLQTLPLPQAMCEVMQDRENLEEMFGKEIRGMAYAYGTFNDDSVRVLEDCGVLYCRTTVSTEKFKLPTDWLRLPATCHHKNPQLPALTQKFTKHEIGMQEEAQLFYLWGHSYEFAKDNNWQIIEDFAAAIGNREDIWYATNTEIFEYIEDFKRLRFDTTMTRAINPTARPLWFSFHKTLYCVQPGQTLALS
ncbi:MAG: polysaccharide deacetylase family protein, partial [Clostridia bacterium]|nr:polysaccharide deacetylase family protein [Clostridia bacterium]